MMIETILAYGFSVIALVMSLTFVWIRHPIHAALSFACAVISAAGICLLQDAAFVAASLVIVYAGATIIIFLFALMFAHQSKMSEYDLRMANPFLACIAAFGLIVALVMLVNQGVVAKEARVDVAAIEVQLAKRLPAESDSNAGTAESEKAEKETTPLGAGTQAATNAQPHLAAFGREFYTRYLLAIEIAGTLLLVATIGSVLIAQRDESERGMREESL